MKIFVLVPAPTQNLLDVFPIFGYTTDVITSIVKRGCKYVPHHHWISLICVQLSILARETKNPYILRIS